MKDITTPEEIQQICFDWALCEDVIYDFAYEDESIDIKFYHPFQILVREEHIIVELKHVENKDIIKREITYKELSEAINKIEIIE